MSINSVSTLNATGVAFGRRLSMIHAAKARALLGQPLSLMVGAVRAHSDGPQKKKKLFKKNKNSDAMEFDVSAAAN